MCAHFYIMVMTRIIILRAIAVRFYNQPPTIQPSFFLPPCLYWWNGAKSERCDGQDLAARSPYKEAGSQVPAVRLFIPLWGGPSVASCTFAQFLHSPPPIFSIPGSLVCISAASHRSKFINFADVHHSENKYYQPWGRNCVE